MKKLINDIQLFSLLLGVIAGAFVALLIFIFYINNGHARMKGYSVAKGQLYETCMRKYGDMVGAEDHMGHMVHSDNPYMMGKVMSETQFLKDMILHHEAAVVMAQEVLALNPSQKVKELADAIISAQAKEIAQMKNWLGQ